jgi:hypothetical protein
LVVLHTREVDDRDEERERGATAIGLLVLRVEKVTRRLSCRHRPSAAHYKYKEEDATTKYYSPSNESVLVTTVLVPLMR